MDYFWKKLIKLLSVTKKTCIKPYVDMNTELRKKAKNYFKKDLFKLMNN